VDETLDPDRLALLPLTRRQLMLGLLGASCVGIGPAATLLALMGSNVRGGRGDWPLIVVPAMLVEFAMCLTVARALTTGLARLLRSRRLRDVATIILGLLGGTAGLLGQLPHLLGRSLTSHAAVVAADVLRWFPPGMAGRAIVDAKAGRSVPALLELAGAATFAFALLVLWSANLDRLLTTVAPSTVLRGRRELRRAGPSLFPSVARFLPRSRIGAVAAKELRLLSREPLSRSQRFLTALFAVGAVVGVAIIPELRRPQVVLGAAGLLWWFNMPSVNQFAIDRASYWMNVASSGDPRDDLIGKNAAAVLVHVPVFVVVALGAAAVTGGWGYVPLTLCLGVAVLGCQLGVGNVTSVRMAQPLPESATNPWATRSGHGAATGFVLLGAFLASGLLLTPVGGLVAAGIASSRAMLWVAAPVSIIYGGIAYLVGLRLAGSWLRNHEPELLAELSPAKSS
jgi:ABC-2 type transport system permease protein